MSALVSKEHVVNIYLQDHRPRLHCLANVQLICSQIKLEKMFRLEDIARLLPITDIDRAINHLHGRLADSYAQPINSFFERHPEFAKLEANRKIVSEALERSHVGATPSEEDLENLLDPGNQSGCFGEFVKSAEAIEQESMRERTVALQEKIIANLPVLRTGGTDRQSERGLKIEREKFVERVRNSSLDELRSIREEQILRQGSVESVRAIVKEDAAKKRQEVNQRYAPWPTHDANGTPCFVPPGKDESCQVPMTRALWARLPNSICHSLLARHGNDIITNVLNAADAAKK